MINSLLVLIHLSKMVKCSHGTIAQDIKALLLGSRLDVKFQHYVFMYVMIIRNYLPGKCQDVSPLFLSTGTKDNFRNMQVFAC